MQSFGCFSIVARFRIRMLFRIHRSELKREVQELCLDRIASTLEVKSLSLCVCVCVCVSIYIIVGVRVRVCAEHRDAVEAAGSGVYRGR